MLSKRRRKPREESGYYWQSAKHTNLNGFVEILPIKITQINEFYHRKQHAKTRKLIGDLFLQKNVPHLINKSGKTHLIINHIYDEREAATLQVWSRLCDYPPTHSVIVGYLASDNRTESVRLTVSLHCVGNRQTWAVQLLGLLISRLLAGSRDGFLLTPNPINAEFWLQCLFAVVCSIREG